MVDIGKLSGRKVTALLSDMNQPLGVAVGNALEVKEAVDTLHGSGPADFFEHCLVVASHLLMLGGKTTNLVDARVLAEKKLSDGTAWQMFRKLIIAQGGDVSFVDQTEKLPKAPIIDMVHASRDGNIAEINARIVGETAVVMGAGRAKKGDAIDFAVGLRILHKVGDHVKKGDALFEIHARTPESMQYAKDEILSAFSWSTESVQPLPLFYDVIRG
jgi:pyrimidine-nucleoside phosphorylase